MAKQHVTIYFVTCCLKIKIVFIYHFTYDKKNSTRK